MHVPGHTPADLAYVIEPIDGTPGVAFVGDTLFMPDVGSARCDFLAAAQNPIRFCAPIVATATGDAAHDVPRLSPEREPLCETTVREQLLHNIHIRDEVAEDEFVRLRQTRDASLAMPTLMLPCNPSQYSGWHASSS